MNITFLIGNGFDTSIGLRTSYNDFYKWYINKKTSKEHIRKFKKDIETKINKADPYWADFEEGLGKYTAEFNEDTVDLFFDCYEDARENLIEYLKIQQSMLLVNSISEDNMAEFSRGVREYYTDLNPQEKLAFDSLMKSRMGENVEFKFLSFNYTNILDSMLKRASKKTLKSWQNNGTSRSMIINPSVIHMHGTTGKYPIFGVNDESQIANKDLLKIRGFKEIMIKSNSVDAIGELWHRDAQKVIGESDIICVWGMSIGITDLKWWQKILDWVRKSDAKHVIVFWHSKNPPNGLSILKKVNIENEVIGKLHSFKQMNDEEFRKILPRIHIVVNTPNVLRCTKSGSLLEITKIFSSFFDDEHYAVKGKGASVEVGDHQ